MFGLITEKKVKKLIEIIDTMRREQTVFSEVGNENICTAKNILDLQTEIIELKKEINDMKILNSHKINILESEINELHNTNKMLIDYLELEIKSFSPSIKIVKKTKK